jgi:hypothetical protein
MIWQSLEFPKKAAKIRFILAISRAKDEGDNGAQFTKKMEKDERHTTGCLL